MKESQPKFPIFDHKITELNLFILSLVREYEDGKIKSWDDLDNRVKTFFTPEMMDKVDAIVPGWKKMSSYASGVTLTHVICVFLGLFIMPEFHALTREQQQLAKWIVLFHDVEKIVRKERGDHAHAVHSAVTVARALPKLDFPVTDKFNTMIHTWCENTNSAVKQSRKHADEHILDNAKLPEILTGIDTMFGNNAPASLIVKGVLFHMSIDVVRDWPQHAPLTDEEIVRFIDTDLLALIKVMHLADNDGWTLFNPKREIYKRETLDVFQRAEEMIQQ